MNGQYSTGSDTYTLDIDAVFLGYGSLANTTACTVDGELATDCQEIT